MHELVDDLKKALEQQRPFVYCRLVATRGSTPQKPGAAMLVYAGGEQSGTLGGGCVEAEVKRRALEMQGSRRADVLRFDLDHDYGWDDGLICGGRMEVLVDDVSSESARGYYRCLAELETGGAGFTEAIVVDADRSGLPAAGAVLFDERNEPAARRGEWRDAQVAHVQEALRPLEDRPGPYLWEGVSFLPIAQRCPLLIVGGGHVGAAVAELASRLEFEIWVADDRAEYASAERFPTARRRIIGDFDETLPALELPSSTYALIVTRGHRHDQTAL